MKYNPETIKKQAIKILELSEFGYDTDTEFASQFHSTPDQKEFGIPLKDTWSVSFSWGREEFGRSHSGVLYIDDATGYPIILVHTSGITVIKFTTNPQGKITSNTGMEFSI